MADDVWLVVGLGNPGPSYAKTRHNVGQMVADELAARIGGGWKQHKQAKAEVVEARISGIRTILAKPRSYMNESGGPVSGLLKFFKVEPAALVVAPRRARHRLRRTAGQVRRRRQRPQRPQVVAEVAGHR